MSLSDPVKLWVAALESGEYEQDQGQLRTDGGFCCLGVLCEVAKEEGIIDYYNRFDAAAVVRWVGLATASGTYNGFENSLIHDNDDNGDSFSDIARTIRLQPKGLFND